MNTDASPLQARKAAGPGELPWEQPCKYELQVALNGLMVRLVFLAGPASYLHGLSEVSIGAFSISQILFIQAGVPAPGKGLGASVMFLLDGSGSVTEGHIAFLASYLSSSQQAS